MIRILQRWLVGMTLPFVIRTILVYGYGVDVPEAFWLWKEVIIGGVLVAGLWSIIFGRTREKRISSLRELCSDNFFLSMWCLLCALVAISMILAFGVHDQSLREWIVFVKYDIFPRIVLLTGYVITRTVWWYDHLAKTMQTIISALLVVGVVRWWLSVWFPDLLWGLGYSMDAYQRSESAAPPVRYLTQVWRWYIRNSSVFGGPTSWWFFLIAFAPRYVWRWLHILADDRKRLQAVFWIVLLVINVGLTFSRAAWGVFAVEFLLIIIIHIVDWYNKQTKKDQANRVQTLFSWLASGVKNSSVVRASGLLFGAGVWWVCATIGLIHLAGPVDVPQAADRDQGVFSRDLSDQGHYELLVEWIQKVWQSPRVGYGVASVWPGAYRTQEAISTQEYDQTNVYHPENQYIQIMMELGIVGFAIWMGLWIVVGRNIMKRWKNDGMYVLLGAVGLAIAWLVLHSMMESMSIYPWMLMMGAYLWSSTQMSQNHKTDRLL